MFNTAAKLYFGLTALALLLAIGYWIGTGDRSGGLLLFALATSTLLAGLVVTGAGISDRPRRSAAEAGAAPESTSLDRSLQPRPSIWPLLFAVSVAIFTVGAAVGHTLIGIGIIAILLAVAGAFAQSFREDPSYTRRLGARVTDRAIAPFLLPIGAFVLIAVVVLGVSRVLLAVPKAASVGIAFGLALLLLLGFTMVAARPRISSKLLAAVSGAAVAVVVAAGAVAGASGYRSFEKHTPPPILVAITAHNISYDLHTITVPVNEPVTVRFINKDKGTYHNVAVYTAPKGGQPLAEGQPISGIARKDYEWTFTTAGQFSFRCDFHANMVGTFVVSATAVTGSGS
jgi:plastocyanin